MSSNFLQQFMAGWQMGQGRNESQRRNQELEMERARKEQILAQRAQEFELEKERFAAEKKRIAAEEAQFNWNAKKQAAALQSRKEEYLPPETQDLGGGTTLNLGAAVRPRAPITAAIPGAPEGTPEVPMPFMEDIQDQQYEQNILEGKMFEVPNDPSIPEAFRGRVMPNNAATAALLQKWVEGPKLQHVDLGDKVAWTDPQGNIVRTAPKGKLEGGGPGGITPNQEAALVDKLGKNWQALSKDVTTMKRQLSMMDSGLTAAKRGDLAAGSQAVLVTFQKILDPTSVVRESEYARSAAGQALLARIEGAFDQVQRGGAGVPVGELEKFAALAKEFIAKSEAGLQGERTRIGKVADRYKIPKDLIFSDESASPGGGAAPQATHRWSPQGGITPIGGK